MSPRQLLHGWNWGQIVLPLAYAVLAVMLAGFVHSGLQGEYGLLEQRRARAVAHELEADLARVRENRRVLENLVTRLSPNSLDLELLDERARKVLGYIRPDELVVR